MPDQENRSSSPVTTFRWPWSANRNRLRSMTLTETLVAGAILGLALVIVALGVNTIRTDLKQMQATELLTTLDEALTAYHSATGQWPSVSERQEPDQGSTAGPAAAQPRATDSGTNSSPNSRKHVAADHADPVIAALAAVPASRAILKRIPAVLRIQPENQREIGDPAQPDIEASRGESSGWDRIQDPWGQWLRCLTAASPSAISRQAVVANGGRPIFISAGMDGQFSEIDPDADADNLRSDELPR